MLLGAFVLCGISIDTGKRDARYEGRSSIRYPQAGGVVALGG